MKTTIKKMKLEDLIPTENNPRQIKKDDFERLKKSVQSFPQMLDIREIVVDENNRILGGHQRVKALLANGEEEVNVKVVEGLSEEEKREFVIRDNIQNGEWDFDALANEWDDLPLGDWGIDLPIADIEEEIVEDEVPEPPAEPKSKLGEIYQLGEHRLMCGDSTDAEQVTMLMDGQKADMVFTDPPYNVAFNGRSGRFDVIENDNLSEDDFNDLITASCNIIRALNPKEYYIWCNWKFYGILQGQLDYKSCIVWAKNVFGMGKGYRHQHEFCLFNGTIDEGINNESDLWEIAKDTNYAHPTQKPVALCARALKNHKNANVVVDLFGGSGSTLVACEQLGRKCYMMELDPHYVDVIIERWENLTGKKAKLSKENRKKGRK